MNSKLGIQKPVLSKKYTDLVAELEQVKQHIANLSAFIQSDDFLHTPDWETQYIKDHKRILGHYKEILDVRIYWLDKGG